MGQIEQTVCKKKKITDVELWLLYSNTWKYLTVCKSAQAHFRMLSMKYVYKSYIYLIHMYKEDFALNNPQ